MINFENFTGSDGLIDVKKLLINTVETVEHIDKKTGEVIYVEDKKTGEVLVDNGIIAF